MIPDHSLLKGGARQENGALNFEILDQVSALVVVLEPDGKILYANPACGKLTGIPAALLVGRLAVEFLSTTQDIDRVQNLLTVCQSDVFPTSCEMLWNAGQDGARLIAWTTNGVLEGERLRYLISTGIEMGSAKSAVVEWEQSETRNQALLAALPDIIFRISRQGTFVDYHAPDADALWLPPENFISKTIEEVLPEPLAEKTCQALQAVLQTGELQFFEYSLPMPHGVNHYETRLTRCGEDEVLAIIRNVTELKQRENNLRRRDAILDGVNFAAGKFLENIEWEQNIAAVLQRLGEVTEASRVYLFKNSILSDGALVTSQRYEWVAPGIAPQIDNPHTHDMPYTTPGFADLAAKLGSGAMFHKTWHEFNQDERSLFGEQGIQSILLMPVFSHGAWWGFIGFDECQAERSWTAAEEEALAAAAHLIGTAIERSSDSHLLRSTLRIAEATHSTLGLEDLYQQIHAVISEMMPARSFYIALYDEVADTLSFPYFVDEYDDEVVSPMKPGKGLTEYVIRTGQSLLASPEVYEDLLVNGEIESVGPPSIDWLGVPLITQKHTFGVLVVQSYTPGVRYKESDQRMLEFVSDQVAMAIERKQAEEALQRQLEELSVLHAVATAGVDAISEDELIERTTHILGRTLFPSNFGLMLLDPVSNQLRIHPSYRGLPSDPARMTIPADQGITWRAVNTGQPQRVFDVAVDPDYVNFNPETRSELAVPIKIGDRIIGLINSEHTQVGGFTEADERLVCTLAGQLATGIERKRREHERDAIVAVAAALRAAPTRSEMLPVILDNLLDLMKAQASALLSTDNGPSTLFVELGRGSWSYLTGAALANGQPISEQVMTTGKPYQVWRSNGNAPEEGLQPFNTPAAAACIPLVAQGVPLGVLWVGRATRFAEDEMGILSAVADMAANGIHRATLHEQTQRRLQRLGALRSVDMAISASLDLRVALNVLLDQLTVQLNIDATDVLLYNHFARALEYAAGRGFMTPAINSTRLRLGEGLAGKAALERHTLVIHKLDESAPEFLKSRSMENESFVTYYAVPLVAKGQLKGLLEIYHRSQLNPDREWIDFLETMGGQAAIAIDNASLFNDLQRSNMELALAYDTTLVGWVRALDLRDQETEGHTQRVIDMTLRLARAVGKSEGDLVNVRRGVLLHDIGKIAIPDSILLKPGPLDENEWEIMRRHPDYAYELLSPISYLRKAIDIPYCHHEKWDGTGYPRGLKGEQIPLAARIFAVVDVWDALRSQRPYRDGWEEEKVREYILSQKGKHFDPEIVDLFMNLLDDTLY